MASFDRQTGECAWHVHFLAHIPRDSIFFWRFLPTVLSGPSDAHLSPWLPGLIHHVHPETHPVIIQRLARWPLPETLPPGLAPFHEQLTVAWERYHLRQELVCCERRLSIIRHLTARHPGRPCPTDGNVPLSWDLFMADSLMEGMPGCGF